MFFLKVDDNSVIIIIIIIITMIAIIKTTLSLASDLKYGMLFMLPSQ
jgi:hypothetical protein